MKAQHPPRRPLPVKAPSEADVWRGVETMRTKTKKTKCKAYSESEIRPIIFAIYPTLSILLFSKCMWLSERRTSEYFVWARYVSRQ
jgi:hypothetical protein